MEIKPFAFDLLSEQPDNPIVTINLLDETKRPFVLICPGGGYTHLAIKKEGTDIQDWLQASGYHTGIFAYQVQNINPTTFLNDLEETMIYLRSQKTISQIFILGFSAGAHVAGLFGTKITHRPDGLLLSYPVVTFSESFGHQGSWQQFLGKNASLTERAYFSIEKSIDASTPPCFIWHTVEDLAVPMKNSLVLAQALYEKAIPVELHLFPHGPHGLGILPDFPAVLQWKELAIQWLQSQLAKEVTIRD